MLKKLIIKNFVLIDYTEVPFAPGFNVITGETGAGKSIIINAIKLLLGHRANPSLIRPGAKEASVEALFDVPQSQISLMESFGIDMEDEELIIKRSISASKKSRVYINGSLFNLKVLAEVGPTLLSISSQHEFQTLLNPDNHIFVLDQYCGIKLKIDQFSENYQEYLAQQRKLTKLNEKLQELKEKREFYQFILAEIEKIKPKRGELQKVQSELRILEHADEVRQTYRQLLSLLDHQSHGVYTKLNQVIALIGRQREYLKNSDDMLPNVEEAYYTVENIIEDLKNDAVNISTDPAMLEFMRIRSSELSNIYRKYGGDEEIFFKKWGEIEESINSIHILKEKIDQLKKSLQHQEDQLFKKAEEIHQRRLKQSKKLNHQITENLQKLAMPFARFEIKLKTANKLNALGIDQVEFLIKTNQNMPFCPIKDVASGGELSRILLSIKALFVAAEEPKTYLFDEVDQGIGGETAHSVAEILTEVSNKTQIIVITHLIQIASKAAAHYQVHKWEGKEVTYTRILQLNQQEREEELARMIGKAKHEDSIQFVKKLLKEVHHD